MKFIAVIGMFLISFISHADITVKGTVTDVNGSPVSKCDVFFNLEKWITDDSVHVQCDDKGRYSASIPEGLYNSIYICDEEQYGKTALEFWGWNLNLTESQTIDAAFDTIEVFSLSTWSSNGGSYSMFASFRPMSLNKVKHSNREVNGQTIAVWDITPAINSGSIKGFINEQPLNLLNYNWTYEKINSCNGFPKEIDTSNGCYMPMIIAQFKKPELVSGQHTLKVRLEDSSTGNIGEGITHFVSNKSGYGF